MRFVQIFNHKSDFQIEYINFNQAYENATEVEKKQLENLIKKMHAGLYTQTFIIPQEREDVSVWLNVLRVGPLEGQCLYMVFGRALSTSNPDILGFVIADIGGDSNCGLVEYIVRKKGFSTVLSGVDMLAMMEKELNLLNIELNGQPLKGIFWESNDPQKVRADEDCMSPQKRIDLIIKKYGAKELGFDYVQGPLEECSDSQTVADKICTNLKLFLYNANSYPHLTAQDIKNYICRFNQVANKSNHPRDLKSPEIDRMMDELDVMIENNIPVVLEQQTPQQRILIQNAGNVHFK